jgi:spermidine synthase
MEPSRCVLKPWKTLGVSGAWSLRQRDNEFMVLASGKILRSGRRHGNEDELARMGCARFRARTDEPRVLLGGLGFGFTLRAVLDAVPPEASVVVSETSPALVEWNAGVLASTHGHALDDHRVKVVVGDVQNLLVENRGSFDVVLLDLDHGPFDVTLEDHQSMYSIGGLSSVRASLRAGGRLAVWSTSQHAGFTKRLTEVGFTASVQKTFDESHLVFLGDLG